MKYFTRKEITNRIKENLDNYDEKSNIGDLFDDLFNRANYINGACEATNALASHWQNDWSKLLTRYSVTLPGTFGAWQLLRHYQEATIGDDDISLEQLLNPEKVANQVANILAAALMDEILQEHHLDYESKLTEHVKMLILQSV